jgi:elongation factor 1-gamma
VGNKKNVFKALIAAEYVGVKIELTPSFEMGVTNKTPEFLKFNPLGKVQQTSFCSL